MVSIKRKTAEMESEYHDAQLTIMDLRLKKAIDPIEYRTAHGIALGQYKMITWLEYIKKLLSSRGQTLESLKNGSEEKSKARKP